MQEKARLSEGGEKKFAAMAAAIQAQTPEGKLRMERARILFGSASTKGIDFLHQV